jgi:hypothetical protein
MDLLIFTNNSKSDLKDNQYYIKWNVNTVKKILIVNRH